LSAVKHVTATSGQQQESPIPPAQQTGSQPTEGLLSQQADGRSGREFYYKMLASIVIVIVLGIATMYVSRKLLPRISNPPGKQIRVVESAYIAPHKRIHLIQTGSRRLLIASTNETITMLADVTDSAPDFAAELDARSKDEK